MHKKLIMACMAMAAFAAFVIAPAASASPVLTHNGVAVPTGTKVIATSLGEIVFTMTGGVEFKCDHATLTWSVTKNSGTKIEGEMTTADFNGTGAGTDCTNGLFGEPFRVNVPKLCLSVSSSPADEVVITGCGANVTFTLNFTNVVTCKYSRASMKAKFMTGKHEVTVNSSEEMVKSEGGAFCPEGFFLDLSFEIWADTGVAHTTANALTIS